ncbi:MAG: chorismate synthase [Rikenellaceae bacterium]|nr:chorismate synthase [Rikenellaceae bacterium]MCL2691822.1 chorismate synthase [Rikenellaceae bacterium]
MNSFGNKLRITLFGESHGPVVGVVIDGVPHGLKLAEADFATDIERRKSGAAGTTARRESDRPELLSGLYNGFTTGAPLAIVFRNDDVRPDDYRDFAAQPRPGHADWTARVRYGGFNDPRGGGQFSGRLTLPLVAAGVVAKRVLGDEVHIAAHVAAIGDETDERRFDTCIERAAMAGDSVGGVVRCTVEGFPAGRGEPFFDAAESVIAHILFAIPGVRSVGFGAAEAAATMLGSEHNDAIVSPDGRTATNHAGGINGGLTNGNPLTVSIVVKPTSSTAREQHTVNMTTGKVESLCIGGRHDVCIALRMPVIVEAAVAIALAQL